MGCGIGVVDEGLDLEIFFAEPFRHRLRPGRGGLERGKISGLVDADHHGCAGAALRA
jgi:hypothetical protein